MVYTRPQLSLREKASLAVAILRALFAGLLASLTGPFRGPTGSPKYVNHVKANMVRAFVDSTTTRQLQAIAPPLSEAYTAYASKHNFSPQSLTLPCGTRAFWLGDPSARKLIIWFHGGGYSLPPDPGHLPFAHNLANSASPDIAVLMLEYSLVPHATYPHQLREGVELLRYCITDMGRRAEDITIGGDSAGANLAMGVLGHLLHPHPKIPPLNLPGKLDSTILLAPWASFRSDWPSMRSNAKKDVVTTAMGKKWSSTFLDGLPYDGYNQPLSVPAAWWDGLDGMVRDILIVAGADEILVDCIVELAARLAGVHGRVETVVAEGEWHDMPTLAALGGGGVQEDAIRAFVRARL